MLVLELGSHIGRMSVESVDKGMRCAVLVLVVVLVLVRCVTGGCSWRAGRVSERGRSEQCEGVVESPFPKKEVL